MNKPEVPDDEADEFQLSDVVQRPRDGVSDVVGRAQAETAEAAAKSRPRPSDQRPAAQRRASLASNWLAPLMYPWTIEGLGAWVPVVIWSGLAGGFWAFTLTFGEQAGPMAIRALLPACVILTVITCSYTACCWVRLVEATANDGPVEDWPAMADWKQWADTLIYMLVVCGQVGVVALALTFWSMAWFRWLPAVVAAWLAPLGMLAAMEADAWVPFSPALLRSWAGRPVAWIGYLLCWAGLIAVTAGLIYLGLRTAGWWFLIAAGPLTGTAMLICGRWAGSIARLAVE